jgi:hypothetical protein
MPAAGDGRRSRLNRLLLKRGNKTEQLMNNGPSRKDSDRATRCDMTDSAHDARRIIAITRDRQKNLRVIYRFRVAANILRGQFRGG